MLLSCFPIGRARMSTLQRDELLTQSEILEKETLPPAKEAHQHSGRALRSGGLHSAPTRILATANAPPFTANNKLYRRDERWGGGHGVFKYFLLKGLQGEADSNHDGTVTTGDLFAYVSEQVRKATSKRQNPKHVPNSAENIPLSGPLVRSQVSPSDRSSQNSARRKKSRELAFFVPNVLTQDSLASDRPYCRGKDGFSEIGGAIGWYRKR